jgi:carnitine monooxygenase subunit
MTTRHLRSVSPGLSKHAAIDAAAARAAAAVAIHERLLRHAKRQTTDCAATPMPVSKSAYCCPERFAREMKALFRGQPLVAGLSGDIPEVGNVMLFDAAGPSILVMRDKSGKARAFLNMCTHRGAKLIEESEPWQGKAKRITCPFHAWTYDNDGKLIAQPSKVSFAGCEIGGRDLIPVPCDEYAGLIFVRPDADAEDVDASAHLGSLAPIMQMLELARAEPVKKGILTADANWKLALDTYGENYHFATLHASTIGQTFFTNVGIFDAFDQHFRVNFPDKGILNVSPTAPEYGGVHYIFPNTVLFFGSIVPGLHFTQLFRLFPVGVDKMICHFAVYAPFGIESEEHREMCLAAYDGTSTVVETEDYRVASAAQANLNHAPDNHQIVFGRNEPALQAMHKHIADAIG